MKSRGEWLGEVVLTRAGDDILPARVIGVRGGEPGGGPVLQVVIESENATWRTWLSPAQLSEIIELDDGHYITRAQALWPEDPA